jgi:DNA-binding Lrp family transcriptional regulator
MADFPQINTAEWTQFVHSDGLDEMSRQIIRLLANDGRTSTIELSRETGASEGTVRRKLRHLLDSGLLVVKGAFDPLLLGNRVKAFIGLDVERRHHAEVAARLAEYDFVDTVYATTGPFDLVLEVTVSDANKLQEFVLDELTFIDGVKDTETYLIGRVYKRHGVVRDRQLSRQVQPP